MQAGVEACEAGTAEPQPRAPGAGEFPVWESGGLKGQAAVWKLSGPSSEEIPGERDLNLLPSPIHCDFCFHPKYFQITFCLLS